MPWHVSQDAKGCSGWAVVQNSNGKVVGCHPSKAKAQAQLAALNINVKGQQMSELPRENLFREIFPGAEVREITDGQPILAGHFARFNEWTEIESVFEGRFMEQIAPGAFTDSLARSTPQVLFQHGRDPDIGDKILGVPTVVREEPNGAYYEVPLFDTTYNADLLPALRAGAYGASFRFSVTNDEVIRKPERSEHNPEGLSERTITKANVAEFGPVTFPAYAGATAGIRSITDEFRPQDFNSQLDLMVREHPKELAARLAEAMKVSEAETPQPKPQPAAPRFRTREEYLEWLSTS